MGAIGESRKIVPATASMQAPSGNACSLIFLLFVATESISGIPGRDTQRSWSIVGRVAESASSLTGWKIMSWKAAK